MKRYGIQHKKSKKLLTVNCVGDGDIEFSGALAELVQYNDDGVIWLTPNIDLAHHVLDAVLSTFMSSYLDDPYINSTLAVECKVVEIDLTVVGQ